jgi:hypothetical protein
VKDFDGCCLGETKVIADIIQLSMILVRILRFAIKINFVGSR